jgi:exodeoxyribonuclease VII large subunit
LTALSYRSVLARGFALVRDEAGHPLHNAASIGPGAALSIEFADGRVAATAGADRPQPVVAPASQPKPAHEHKPAASKRTPDPADQGSLF